MGQTVNLLSTTSVVRIHLRPQWFLDRVIWATAHDGHTKNAKVAQLVEHDLAKVGVAGSSPVFRSRLKTRLGPGDASPVFRSDKFRA